MSVWWTNHEVATLRQLYAAVPIRDIQARLPRRSRSSIRAKAIHIALDRMPIDIEHLRWSLIAQAYFIDRATRGVIAAQERWHHD